MTTNEKLDRLEHIRMSLNVINFGIAASDSQAEIEYLSEEKVALEYEAAEIRAELDAEVASEAGDPSDEMFSEDGLTNMEADAMTLRDAGWGTDEDYGYYGDDFHFMGEE